MQTSYRPEANSQGSPAIQSCIGTLASCRMLHLLNVKMAKTCFIVAGPNGAGKTTFAATFLPNEAKCFNFINADLSRPDIPFAA